MSEAEWALTGVVVGALLSAGASWLMQSRQFRHEMRMFSLANQGKDAVKTVLLEMLNHKAYTDRSFEALRERFGGFTDDELRQILHELGASKTSREEGSQELWYLKSCGQERRDKRAQGDGRI